ncbi:MAG: NUDIX hydrolase [Candidatus Omnitrophica bacterium]|nr:NUDIX hydrolase [Candidatus Omnitrophota bacterium]
MEKENPKHSKVLKRLKKKIIYNGKFLRFIKEGEWEYVKRSNCRAIVIIVAMTDDKRVLFVEQYRPAVGKKVIEFPAGLVGDHGSNKTESIMRAAKRELLEETGYQAGKITKIIEGPVSSGCCADIVTMVRAQDLRKVSCGGGDELEWIIVHEVPLNKTDPWLNRMRRKKYLVEPKIYTGLYFLKTYNKL